MLEHVVWVLLVTSAYSTGPAVGVGFVAIDNIASREDCLALRAAVLKRHTAVVPPVTATCYSVRKLIR